MKRHLLYLLLAFSVSIVIFTLGCISCIMLLKLYPELGNIPWNWKVVFNHYFLVIAWSHGEMWPWAGTAAFVGGFVFVAMDVCRRE